MVDSWGDGWNGSTFDLDGVALGTIVTGATGSFTFSTGSAACAVLGCTDPTASNYDPTATVDDGSCTYPCLLDEVTLTLTDSYGDGWNGGTLTIDGVSYTQGSYSWPYTAGASESFVICVDLSTCITATYSAGSYSYENSWSIVDASGSTIASGGDNSDDFGVCAISGCTDSTATNYDATATVDDGTCIYVISGCTDATATNYDATATVDDGTCTYCVGTYANISVGGGSYMGEVSWTLSDGTGSAILSGGAPFSLDTCLADDCYTVDMVDSYGDGWSGSTFDFDGVALGTILTGSTGSFTFSTGSASCAVTGCTDPTATNYDATATVDDGSCVYPCLLDEVTLNLYDSYGDGGGSITIDGSTYTLASGSSQAFTAICVDLSICNTATYAATDSYSSENSWDIVDASGAIIASGGANSDDFGSCIVIVDGCTDSIACNYNPLANNDDGTCNVSLGCTDSTATNYDATACIDDASCIASIYGCTDPSAINYYPGANADDGSCCLIAGCMTATASNYDPAACIDDGSCLSAVSGCTDASATNYAPTATVDDGSCTYNCNAYPTGLNVFDVIDNRVNFAWDNMNSTNCLVLKYYVRYREVGASAWNTRAAGVGNGLCNFGLNTTSQLLLGLTASTTYEWKLKAFYCGGSSSNYSPVSTFTTADACPILANLAVQTYSGNHTKANFTWDSTGTYTYARVALRVDTTGSAWQTVGGFGTFAPALSQIKFGLTAGESYRAGARAYCNANISSHRSWWTPFIFWTQPGIAIKLEGGTAINHLDVYPNPSRDIFNVSFTSEDAQDLEVRVINVVGEVVYTESLSQFIGEYTKQVDLANYTKGVYFLEITTNNGVINKKLILQ